MKTITPRLLSISTVLFVVFGITSLASADTRTLRIVCYNILCDTTSTTPNPGLITPQIGGSITNGGVLEGIGEENVGPDPAQPIDILALEETTSNTTTVTPIVNGLNTYYNTPGMYAMSSYQATESGGSTSGGNGPNALVYNTTTVQLLASVPVDPPPGKSLGSSSGEYREVMRYEFAPAGVTATATNEFYIYVSHYKASTGTANATLRLGEAQIIRTNETGLPANARVLYVGDYNPDNGSGEPAYQTIISNTAPNGIVQGGGIDPMNPSGAANLVWSDGPLLVQNTDAASSLRYRDDLQVMTTNVYYGTPGGLAYVPGTYHAFGNNGTTPDRGSVGSGNSALTNLVSSAGYPYYYITANGLYADLTTASDHLPVVADYTIPLGDVAAPVASFNATPTNGVAALAVTFTDTSTGSITNWAWTFGDGGTTNLTTAGVAYTYSTPGTYSVTEVVSGSGGVSTNTATNYITVLTPPPMAHFTATPTNGVAALAVTFTDTSTGSITNWAWTFGDGGTTNATTTSVLHTYSTPGTYNVTEIVSGSGGVSTNTATNCITVLTPPPVASFTATPTNGAAALTVNFTDTSTGSITNWAWTFGDGGTTNVTTTSVAHIYNTPGTYDVQEIVTGAGGSNTNKRTGYITVSVPPTLPTVQVTQGAGSVVLTWPTPTMPYHLISAPTVSGPWSPDPDALSTNGGSVTATIPLTSTQYYYRLQGQ